MKNATMKENKMLEIYFIFSYTTQPRIGGIRDIKTQIYILNILFKETKLYHSLHKLSKVRVSK